MAGGAGDDLYVVNMAGETVTELANAGTDTVRSSVSYVLGATLENLELAAGAGNLSGTGNAGQNQITGNEGDNVLAGLAGADTLTGGAGNDRFLFSTAPSLANADTITDFASGDHIVVDNDVFTGLPVGALNDAAFAHGPGMTAAGDPTDRFVYNETTGDLYYDAGGTAGAAAVLLAHLDGAPALTAADFLVAD